MKKFTPIVNNCIAVKVKIFVRLFSYIFIREAREIFTKFYRFTYKNSIRKEKEK